jgi:hypothetical protein
MTKSTCCALVLSLSTLALADVDGDAVNERIPVDKKALENHWQVNCADAWARWQTSAAERSTRGHCEKSTDLAHELKLCAFIYQPPGANSQHQYPDYRGASQQLEQPPELAD